MEWILEAETMDALEAFRCGEMKAALKTRRDQIKALKRENETLRIQKKRASEMARLMDRGIIEVGER